MPQGLMNRIQQETISHYMPVKIKITLSTCSGKPCKRVWLRTLSTPDQDHLTLYLTYMTSFYFIAQQNLIIKYGVLPILKHDSIS